MIVKLGREQQRTARRQLLCDVTWAISNDTLRAWHREGKTGLSPVELFLSAKNFSDAIAQLDSIDEGIDYEIDDLMDEAPHSDDPMIIMVLAALMLMARSKRKGIDFTKAIGRIFERCGDDELFMPLIDLWMEKEGALWAEGRLQEMIGNELQEIDTGGDGSEEVKNFLHVIAQQAENIDADSIRGVVVILGKYNMDHGHAYDKEINEIYDKLGIKTTITVRENDKPRMTVSEKEIKQAIEALMEAKDDNGNHIMRTQDQWFAVFRVLSQHCGFPKSAKEFATTMKNIGVAGQRVPCKYDSFRKVTPQNLPPNVDLWGQYENHADNYSMKQVKVAQKLMDILHLA